MGSADGGGGRFACSPRRAETTAEAVRPPRAAGGASTSGAATAERARPARRGLGHAAGQRFELLSWPSCRRPRRSSTTPIRAPTITYGGGGSGKGRTDLAEKTVDFAGSDSPYKDADKPAEPDPVLPDPARADHRLVQPLGRRQRCSLSPDTIAGSSSARSPSGTTRRSPRTTRMRHAARHRHHGRPPLGRLGHDAELHGVAGRGVAPTCGR